MENSTLQFSRLRSVSVLVNLCIELLAFVVVVVVVVH